MQLCVFQQGCLGVPVHWQEVLPPFLPDTVSMFTLKTCWYEGFVQFSVILQSSLVHVQFGSEKALTGLAVQKGYRRNLESRTLSFWTLRGDEIGCSFMNRCSFPSHLGSFLGIHLSLSESFRLAQILQPWLKSAFLVIALLFRSFFISPFAIFLLKRLSVAAFDVWAFFVCLFGFVFFKQNVLTYREIIYNQSFCSSVKGWKVFHTVNIANF